RAHPVLPCFPTRRSSDLPTSAVATLLDPPAPEGDRLVVQGLDRPASEDQLVVLRAGREDEAAAVAFPHREAGTDVRVVPFERPGDRKSTRLNSSHVKISY